MIERLNRPPMAEIIGDGDIASALEGCGKKGMLFFASGVSNSQETRESEYQREKDLLLAQDRSKRLVYFSSLCIFHSPDSRYAQHKREMEELIKDNFDQWTIMRLGNITWGSNPNTLINHFKYQRMLGESLTIMDTERYIMDKEEFRHWVGMIPQDRNVEMNITARRMNIREIVEEFVDA